MKDHWRCGYLGFLLSFLELWLQRAESFQILLESTDSVIGKALFSLPLKKKSHFHFLPFPFLPI